MVVVLVVLLIITLILGIYWKYEEKERSEQRANYPQARCNISIVIIINIYIRKARKFFLLKTITSRVKISVKLLMIILIDERFFVTYSFIAYGNNYYCNKSMNHFNLKFT